VTLTLSLQCAGMAALIGWARTGRWRKPALRAPVLALAVSIYNVTTTLLRSGVALPSRERNSDEQFRGIAEIASAETRPRDGSPVTETIYTHVISEDGKRIAAQLGNAVWGVLDAIGSKMRNGSEGASSKPFLIN
jgi:hypothetical protein